MTKEYMAKVFAWSDGVCPPSTYFSAVKTKEELTLVTKHLMYKAFSSTGWTIWTRNFELIKLKEKDLMATWTGQLRFCATAVRHAILHSEAKRAQNYKYNGVLRESAECLEVPGKLVNLEILRLYENNADHGKPRELAQHTKTED
ncbi:hypothetical protein B0H14DRAFT_2622372 [Mycena olivaceomarginata]|nr:hypothetical protein B0H14DRAFT_2622372 [Mycena olivaceomarginata]